MTQSINADMQISMSSETGHGHETYTVDPCLYDSNLNIATKIKSEHSHQKYTVDICVKRLKFEHSHQTYNVDLCNNTLNILQRNLDLSENIQGLYLCHSIV
jgi:hypothetical protein